MQNSVIYLAKLGLIEWYFMFCEFVLFWLGVREGCRLQRDDTNLLCVTYLRCNIRLSNRQVSSCSEFVLLLAGFNGSYFSL